MPSETKDHRSDPEYWKIGREQAEVVDRALGTEEAARALAVITDYLEMDRTTEKHQPGVFAGMWKFRNAITQHLLAMEWWIAKESKEATDARRSD